MREISVSTAVFAALWSKRREGENSESDILERILEIRETQPASAAKSAPPFKSDLPRHGGISIVEFNVHFPEEAEIFRVYKGQRYVAVVKGRRWWMNGKFYSSLHKLSTAVVKGRENSWNNWKTLNKFGKEVPIDRLRDQTLISRR